LSTNIFLITPPFTQLNTPYPATAYLKGFLNTKNIASQQADLGIEVILKLFTKTGLSSMFDLCPSPDESRWNSISENARRIIQLKQVYIDTIEQVILFLQEKNNTLAHLFARRGYLPEAARFEQMEDLQWAFGSMGIHDQAKHMATLYLEDLSDLIKECVDEDFGFSRYAEKIGRSANSFDALHQKLREKPTFIDKIMMELLQEKLVAFQPSCVAISVPFPGNLYAGFRIADHIKQNHPHIKTILGGGFPNTELRSLKDSRVFEYFDHITLDDGEAPLENLIHFFEGNKQQNELKRTYLIDNGELVYINNQTCKDYTQELTGTPDYSGLPLRDYLQVIEVVNPMHSLWNNGRWNKLTMAHGCYWGKCTFCDISLDYIKIYEPNTASMICDRMEEMINATGETGFHFVDEAAPPSLMKALALEIIRRRMVVTWWTNIRFEKRFTLDLCMLLRDSGCIGVSGGLEVASDRLLKLINKGITVAQVAEVNRNFTESGIMVHAYLMYGYPTQTVQETIDSLEMVRQMFKLGILQSAFWHLFTMTAHSPVGLAPEKFGVRKAKETDITFADNDVEHIDDTGIDHESFGYGLKKSLFNFMHGIGLDEPVQKWFDFKVPKTTIQTDYIANIVENANQRNYRPESILVFHGQLPKMKIIEKSKKGNHWKIAALTFQCKQHAIEIRINLEEGEWLLNLLHQLIEGARYDMKQVQSDYESRGLENFELFWDNKPINQLHKAGLLML
jgi:hypothetical protein